MKTLIHVGAAIAALQMACLSPAAGATAGLGTAVPDAGDGVQNLNFSTSDATNTQVQYNPNDYLAGDNGSALGQTFTTGSNADGYHLSSISVRQVSWGTTFWDFTGGTVTLQVFRINSNNGGGVWGITQLALETATVGGEDDGLTYSSGTPGANARWLTVTLDSPVVLAPNTIYGFQIVAPGTGGNDQFFLQLDGTSTNSYAGGFAIGTGKVGGQPDPGLVYDGGNGQPSDRAFVATMTSLTEPTLPVFVTQPQGYFGDVGDTVTLTATANASPAPTYRWEYSPDGVVPYTDMVDGGPIAGAATNTLSFNPAVFSHNGFYRAVATNTGGYAISDEVQVDLSYPAPVITAQAVGGAVPVGSDVSFTVAATGLGTLSYQWYNHITGLLTDGGSITGATSATLVLSNVQLADADRYYCEVTDHAATETGTGGVDASALSVPAQLEVFTANSGLVSFEPFVAYPTDVQLTGQNPLITGYFDPWADQAVGNVVPQTSADALSYGGAGYRAGIDGKVASPTNPAGIAYNDVNYSGRGERLLASNLKGTPLSSQTLYLSWLFKTGNEGLGTGFYQTLGLWNGTSANDALRVFEAGVAAGFGSSNYSFRVNNSTTVNLGVPQDANTHLFVAKFVFSSNANHDSVTVWIDPSLGAGEPTGGALVAGVNLAFDRLALSDYAANSSAWDEIRWGSTFDSVTVEAPVLPTVPEFRLHPVYYAGTVGDAVTLTAYAEGDPAPTYQWQFDDGSGFADLTNETSSTLSLNPATYANNGSYRVVATNTNGSTVSNAVNADLIYPAPVITQQPQPAAGLAGANVTLSVTATGMGNLGYAWYKVNEGGDILLSDDGNISGATTSSLQINGVGAGDDGNYYVVVSDDAALPDEGHPTQAMSNSIRVTVADLLLTSSAVAPTTDEFDQFYLPGTIAKANNVSGGADASTYIAFDRASKGMSFTTGSDRLGYSLNAISLQHVAHAGTAFDVQNLDTFEFSFGTLSGTTKTVIYQSSKVAYLGDPIAGINVTGTGRFFTFDLSGVGIGTLSPNTTYYFEVATELGDPFLEWNGTSADGYAAGGAFNGGATGQPIIDESYVAMPGDRAFVVDLTGLSGPADDYASWIAGYPGVGMLTGFNDDADGDGLKNGLENVFGSDPSVSNPGIVQSAKSGNTFTFQHPNAAPATDVSAAYVWSTDLAGYNADGATSGGTTVNFTAIADSPVAGTTTVTATISGTVPAKLFVAVEAAQSTP